MPACPDSTPAVAPSTASHSPARRRRARHAARASAAALLLLALGIPPAAAQPAQPAPPPAPAPAPSPAPAHSAASAPVAPPAPPAAMPIAFASVAQALATLRARDGNGTVVTEADGWITINEPLAAAQWSFTPPGHAAHPALVRRIIQRGPAQAIGVDLALLCEAPATACQQLRQQFEAMNDRIVQALKARGRSASTPPPPAAQ